MKYRIPFSLAGVAAAVGVLAMPALAHHSFSMFDRNKEISIEGEIKEMQWTNPHVWIYLFVPDDKGKKVEWSIEHSNPNTLSRQGWKRNTFKAGDKVLMIINPARDGGPSGAFVSAQLPDGRVLGNPEYIEEYKKNASKASR